PQLIEGLEERVIRAYRQYHAYPTKLQQNIYLGNLNNTNQVLFYRLVSEHLADMLPTIYTPIVGSAVKQYSEEYRQPRGLYITYADKDIIDDVLQNRSNPQVDLIVVTDGEGVLGIGDQGVGGMDIPVAKLMVYTLCGGVNPCRTLPIFLDVGTNNESLLNDPLYLGWRHPRLIGKEYDDFIHAFVQAVQRQFPKAFLHWEDFGAGNARRILHRFQDKLCTFNDDIQGTGAVTLAALLAAVNVTGTALTQQRIVVFGAGSAGTGVADQICAALLQHGLTREQAYRQFWLIDRQGLLVQGDSTLSAGQLPYARDPSDVANWQLTDANQITLQDVVTHVKPTVLIGCSAVANAFSESVVRTMYQHAPRPIIFPLSNPTERCEAQPIHLLDWTDGQALIATGTAFEDVHYHDRNYAIAQCNNALVFPGIGLGVLAVGAKRLTSDMIWQVCIALSECSPARQDPYAPLLPSLDHAQHVAKYIAKVVAEEGIKQKFATKNQQSDLTAVIEELFWQPHYLPYEYVDS
ncbi:MAG: oxaloacetate-decarboxylating malate dehydrogenase, partial [Legionellales bacterium]|nr:oxaloacetate-decarboxylating malate dehydrogenase [Legionellales bacterium]